MVEKKNIYKIFKKYEEAPLYKEDFSVGRLAESARLGNAEALKRFIGYLQKKYPNQTEDIQYLQEYLSSQKETEEVQEEAINEKDSPPRRPFHSGMKYDIAPDEDVAIHPVADSLPMMDAEALERFAEDIRINEQQDRVLTIQGVLIDGRNRLKACRMLGIPTKAEEISDKTDVVSRVISLNMSRRQLTQSQKATTAVLLMSEMGKLKLAPNEKTRDRLAKQFGVGTTYVQNAKAVYDHDRALFDKVHNGTEDLKKAYGHVKRTSPARKTQAAAWISSFVNVLNIISEDNKEELREVLNCSTGKAKTLIQDKLNTFVETDFDAQIKTIDEKTMEMENGY
jgi:hypothetical protein